MPGPDETAEAARPSLAGQLLVAAPWIGDPDFERTVVLIVEDGPDGAVGIVINKPIGEQPLADVFKALGQKKAMLRAARGSSAARSSRRLAPRS